MQDPNTQPAGAAAQSNNPTKTRDWKKRFKKTVDTGTDLAETLTPIVKDVAEVLKDAPLVKTIAGVILHIIEIKEEIEVNDKRCHEIISKVLHLSEWICKRLHQIGKHGERVRDMLTEIETSLKHCEVTLTKVFQALEKRRDRSRLARWTKRGLEDLEQIDRSVDSLTTMLHMDITFSNAVQQAKHDSDSNAIPTSLPTPGGSTHVLPPKPHLMVERDDQLKITVEILVREKCSRVAILGGGGFGKTTLALSILHHPEIAKRYESRYFLSCEPLGNVETVLTGLGAMLGIKAVTSEMLASVRSHLANSTTLLCLDNFETSWEPPASRTAIEDLLASIADIPNLSLIITMRGTELPSKGHWQRLLQPLSTLSSESARQILQSICPDHIINASTEKLLDAIEGIPLAITLIANLLRNETSEELWDRWFEEQTGIVETGGHDREANLNASIKLSVNSPRMKDVPGVTTLLAALAWLPDGFPAPKLKELEKYLGVSNIGRLLRTLRTVALIKPDEAIPSSRIQMLSPVRLFCHQFPDLSLEIKLAFENLVTYYVHLLSGTQSDLDNIACYDQIVPEIKNVHSILQNALRASPGGSQDPALHELVEAVIYLSTWSNYIGYYAKDTIEMARVKTTHLPILYGRCLIEIGLLHQSEAEDNKAEKCFREAAVILNQENEHFWEALALQYLGDLLIYMWQLDRAETTLGASLELFIQINNKHGQANVRYFLGKLSIDRGQYSKAEEHLTGALEAYKLIQGHLGQSNAAESLTHLHYDLGNLVKAEEFANTSLAVAKKANYAQGEGNALARLGNIYLHSDRLIDARQNFEQALAIYTKINDPLGQLDVVDDLGKIYIQLDELSTAEVKLMESAKMELEIVHTPYVLTTLGWLYICSNRVDRAEPILDKAFTLFQKFEDEFGQALVLVHLGTIYLQSNRHNKAEQVLNDIAELNQDVEMPDIVMRKVEMCRLWVLGDLYIAKGQLEDAQASLDAAMVNAKNYQSSYQQGNILRSIGTLHIERGDINSAITKFQEALEFHRKAQWVSEQAVDFQRLGEAYERLGRSKDAEAAFKQAKELMDSVRETRTLSLSA